MPRARRLVNQINIVPYVDVMLVLLVIFMVTAPFMTPGVVNLPSVGKSAQVAENPIEVDLKRDGRISVRERRAGGSGPSEVQLGSEEFGRYVRDRLAGTEQPVVIAADREVRYDAVMRLMDELQRANVKRVGLLVKHEEAGR
jgi:biopolymer transport protein TolR